MRPKQSKREVIVEYVKYPPRKERRENNMAGVMKLAQGGKADFSPINIKHPGALHRALDIPMDKKIPLKVLKKEEDSKSPLMRKRVNFALNARKFDKK